MPQIFHEVLKSAQNPLRKFWLLLSYRLAYDEPEYHSAPHLGKI